MGQGPEGGTERAGGGGARRLGGAAVRRGAAPGRHPPRAPWGRPRRGRAGHRWLRRGAGGELLGFALCGTAPLVTGGGMGGSKSGEEKESEPQGANNTRAHTKELQFMKGLTL